MAKKLILDTLKAPEGPTDRASFRFIDQEGDLFAIVHTKFIDEAMSKANMVVLNASGGAVLPVGQQFTQILFETDQENVAAYVSDSFDLETVAKNISVQGLLAGTHADVLVKEPEGDRAVDALNALRRRRGAQASSIQDTSPPYFVMDIPILSEFLQRHKGKILPCAQLETKNPLSGFAVHHLVKDHPAFSKAASLDISKAKACLKACHDPSSSAVAYYGDTTHFAHKYRVQAAESLPIMADIFARTHSLANTIDLQKSLNPLLEERFGLSKGAMKRLRKVTEAPAASALHSIYERVEGFDALGMARERTHMVSGGVSLEEALDVLKGFPPDWMPASNDEWRAFQDVLVSMAMPLKRSYDIPVEDTLSSSKGQWVRFRDSLARSADFDPAEFAREQMALAFVDGLEAITRFSRDVVVPLALSSVEETGQRVGLPTEHIMHSGEKAALACVIDASKNKLGNILEFGRKYIASITRLSALQDGVEIDRSGDVLSRYGDNEWPAISNDFRAANGFAVEVLTDQQSITGVASALRNCIGSYLNKCRTGQSHVMAVKSPNGVICSAFEIRGKQSDASEANWRASPQLFQHQAYENANLYGPSYSSSDFSARDGETAEDLIGAVDEYLAAWKSGSLELHVSEVRSFLQAIEEEKGKVVAESVWKRHLGWDPIDPEMRGRYWQEWRDTLGGKPARSEHPGVLYKQETVRDVVHQISPEAGRILLERNAAPQARREAEPTL